LPSTMRILFCIFCLMLIPGILPGQSAEEKTIQMKAGRAVEETGTAFGGRISPVTWNLSLGTGFAFIPGAGQGMMLHAAPMLTVPVTDRWSLHGGVMAMQTFGWESAAGLESGKQPVFSSLALFAAASYRMSDRLILHGTGIKQLVPASVAPFAPPDHFSLGATYRLGDNMTIGATIHMDQGNGHFLSPFHGGGFFPPYRGSGFYSPYAW